MSFSSTMSRAALDALYIPLLTAATQNLETANDAIVKLSGVESVVNEFTVAAHEAAKKMYDDAHSTYYHLRDEYMSLKEQARAMDDAADALLTLRAQGVDPEVAIAANILSSMR